MTLNEDEYEDKCSEILEEIMEVTDKYQDYIEQVSIKWKNTQEKTE